MTANFSKEGQSVMEGIDCTADCIVAILNILVFHEGKTAILHDRESRPNVAALVLKGKIEEEKIKKSEIYKANDKCDIFWCPADEKPQTIPFGKDWIITVYD
ncbi:hypothetical protein ES703_40024 [subsurface metagenome]